MIYCIMISGGEIIAEEGKGILYEPSEQGIFSKIVSPSSIRNYTY